MPKKSAGLVVYHFDEMKNIRVLLVHPGGPFFTHKDNGVWSIPKGEYNDDEDALTVARREFQEETGNVMMTVNFTLLTSVKLKSGKQIIAWAAEEYFEKPFISSNLFEMEWPPKTGSLQWFPETDDAGWFTLEEAKKKLYENQHPFIDALKKLLDSNG